MQVQEEEAEVMAGAEVMAAAAISAAAVISAEVDTSEVVDISVAVDISAAALALAECVSAVRISAARASAAGLGYRGLRRGQVSAANARLRFTAVPTGPPAARQR
jgi:hypothetical protein